MKTITHHNQPYGTVVFTAESVAPVLPQEPGSHITARAEAGWVEVRGKVLKGSVTSRLLNHTHTLDLTGSSYSLQLPPEDFERGEYTSVAM